MPRADYRSSGRSISIKSTGADILSAEKEQQHRDKACGRLVGGLHVHDMLLPGLFFVTEPQPESGLMVHATSARSPESIVIHLKECTSTVQNKRAAGSGTKDRTFKRSRPRFPTCSGTVVGRPDYTARERVNEEVISLATSPFRRREAHKTQDTIVDGDCGAGGTEGLHNDTAKLVVGTGVSVGVFVLGGLVAAGPVLAAGLGDPVVGVVALFGPAGGTRLVLAVVGDGVADLRPDGLGVAALAGLLEIRVGRVRLCRVELDVVAMLASLGQRPLLEVGAIGQGSIRGGRVFVVRGAIDHLRHTRRLVEVHLGRGSLKRGGSSGGSSKEGHEAGDGGWGELHGEFENVDEDKPKVALGSEELADQTRGEYFRRAPA
ncbi:uncharacterized protein PG998_002898 [Apiospora kogelbergensis]|uniref:uncharacterized protein n=1 Tax=Apiospora kogelbergensis TaxID=1337665 RepID=UPI00312F8FFC